MGKRNKVANLEIVEKPENVEGETVQETTEDTTVNKVVHFSPEHEAFVKNIKKQLGIERDELVAIALNILMENPSEFLKKSVEDKINKLLSNFKI